MMVNGGASLSNNINMDELTSGNVLKIEDADFSRTYSVQDTSITDALDRFYESDTSVNKKYRQIVNNMEFSPKLKEMFAYNIQCYIENYDRNAKAFGFDATMEETLDQVIQSAKDVGYGIHIGYNIGPNIAAYTEGVGKDDSEKRITLSGDGNLGYNSLFHEIEHTDQGMDIQNSEIGYFDGLACPKKFYRFIQEGDAEFLQLLGSDSIIDTGMSFGYSDSWSMYNMLMQTVGANELHEYVKTGCKNEQFIDFVNRRFDEQGLSKEQSETFILSLQNCLGGRMEYAYRDRELASEPNTEFGVKAFKSYTQSKNKTNEARFKELEDITLDVLETKLENAESKEEIEDAIQDMSRFKLFSSCNDAQIKNNSLDWNDSHFEMADKILEDKDIYSKMYDAYVEKVGELELDQDEFVECFDTSYECAEILESIQSDNEFKIDNQEKEKEKPTEEITLDDADEKGEVEIVQEEFIEDNKTEVKEQDGEKAKEDNKTEVKEQEDKKAKEDNKTEVKEQEDKKAKEDKKSEVKEQDGEKAKEDNKTEVKEQDGEKAKEDNKTEVKEQDGEKAKEDNKTEVKEQEDKKAKEDNKTEVREQDGEKAKEDNKTEVKEQDGEKAKEDKKSEVKEQKDEKAKEDNKTEVKEQEDKKAKEDNKTEVKEQDGEKTKESDEEISVLEDVMTIEEAMEQEKIEAEEEVLEDVITIEEAMEQEKLEKENEKIKVKVKKKAVKKEGVVKVDKDPETPKNYTTDKNGLISRHKKQEENGKKIINVRRRKGAEENIVEESVQNISKMEDDFKSNLQGMTESGSSNENKIRFTINQINQMKKDLTEVLKKGKISMYDALEAVEQIKQGKVPDVIKNKDDKELDK